VLLQFEHLVVQRLMVRCGLADLSLHSNHTTELQQVVLRELELGGYSNTFVSQRCGGGELQQQRTQDSLCIGDPLQEIIDSFEQCCLDRWIERNRGEYRRRRRRC